MFGIKFQIKVVLIVFLRIKRKIYCIKGSRKVRPAECKNCPNFVTEFLGIEIYSFLHHKFYYDVICMVYVIFIRSLKPLSN